MGNHRSHPGAGMTAYEAFMTWLIINELYVIWRVEAAR